MGEVDTLGCNFYLVFNIIMGRGICFGSLESNGPVILQGEKHRLLIKLLRIILNFLLCQDMITKSS
jgi:hypothetical protein